MSPLLRLERKEKHFLNAFRIRIFLFRSNSFGIETITTFISSRSSLENHTRFQTKMGKVYTRFQIKKAQNHTLWGGTYQYSSYKRVPPGSILTYIVQQEPFYMFITCAYQPDSEDKQNHSYSPRCLEL